MTACEPALSLKPHAFWLKLNNWKRWKPKEPMRLKHAKLFLLFALTLSANAETLRGVVKNGTTNKPSAGDEVVLKRVGNGMEDVGATKTNSKGELTLNPPATRDLPYLFGGKH